MFLFLDPVLMKFEILLDLLFGTSCRLCGHPGDYVCSACENNFIPDSFQSCPNCGSKNEDGKFCDSDVGECGQNFLFDQLIVSMDYGKSDFLRKSISSYKYDLEKMLCVTLAKPMKHQFFRLRHKIPDEKNIILCPVPLHKKKLKQRGFNQSLLLAKQIDDENLLDCLEREIFLSDQAKLSKSQRLKNLRGSIRVKGEFVDLVKNKSVVVVDDVATTGSTLNECAAALKNCGVPYVCGLVLARVR